MIGLGIAVGTGVPFSSEAARRQVVRVLAEHLDSEVELQGFRLRVFPKLRVEGDELTIRHRGRRDVPPLISIAHFAAEGSLATLLRKRVSLLTVQGLDIEIPPDRNRGPTKEEEEGAEHRRSAPGGGQSRAIVIEEMISSDAKLAIIPQEKDKPPRVWNIHRLRMRSLGIDQAMPFDATLTNAVPPGEIETSGSFGPWQAPAPGQTPLDGKFKFDRADLSVFKGISGILSAHGALRGTLARIDIDGVTDTPQFTVTPAGHPVPLHTTYHAIVDGTNGNTQLDPVNGSFLNTSLVATGGVVGTPGKDGRTLTLDITMTTARLEDVLKLAVKTPISPMAGALQLKTRFVLPPGDQAVIRKLELEGRFSIRDTRFTNVEVQKKINELSHRGRGQTQGEDPARVTSQFKGTFNLRKGTLQIPDVTFDITGAIVQLAGKYNLVSEALNFSGKLQAAATISEMTGGVKGKILRVVDPVFAKKGGGGTEVPIKINGTRENPSFGLDTRGLFRRRSEESKSKP